MYNKINLQASRTLYKPVSARDLARNLKEWIVDKGIDNVNTKFQVDNRGMKVLIAIDSRSQFIEKNPVAKMGLAVKDPFKITDKLRELIAPMLNEGVDPTISVFKPNENEIRVVVHLIPQKVLDVLLPKATGDRIISINRIVGQKGDPLIYFEAKEVNNKKNKNRNNNNGNRNKFYK